MIGSTKLYPCAKASATPVGATGTKLDRRAVVEKQALATVRQLLTELGSSRGLEDLRARGMAANLERELGLGSLERVELMLRLGNACGVRLPERVVAEANSVEDLIEAILREDVRENDASGATLSASAAVGPMRGSVSPPDRSSNGKFAPPNR